MTYTRGEFSIGVGNLPGRKRPCLYIGNKYCIHQVASFSNEENAKEFTRWLEYFFNLRISPNVEVDDGED